MAKAKEIEGLDCDAGAGEMIRLALEARFADMLEHRDAALEGDGVDGVHDMRVASRRLRSALRDYAPYLNAKRLDGAADELKRLADALGRVRDQDVALHALEKVALDAPPEVCAGVEEFARGRRALREEGLARLVGELDAGRLEELRAEFSSALGRAAGGPRRGGRKKKDGRAPAHTFGEVSREIILGRWEELRDRCASLHRPFKVKRLHKARIAAKRLRYALELFAPCGGEHLREFAGEIAKMQKSLGDLHDCDEWIATLGDWLTDHQRPARDGRDGAAAQGSAAVWLLGHFVGERTKCYNEALARWHKWEAEDFGSRLREAISGASTGEENTPVDAPSTEAQTSEANA